MILDLVFYLIAAILFALAGFNVQARVNLVALGLLACVLVPLLHVLTAA